MLLVQYVGGKMLLDVFDAHVHIKVSNPGQWVDDMAAAGADIFCFHVEIEGSEDDKIALIHRIKAKGMKVGIAIKPNTPVESVFPFEGLLDQILVMTVEPGFGGQKFMHHMMPKVRTTAAYMLIHIGSTPACVCTIG